MVKQGRSLDELTGMKEWREQDAMSREIEQERDKRLARLRAGMLEELVKRSPQVGWNQEPTVERPRCERCGSVLVSRSKAAGCKPVEVSRWRWHAAMGPGRSVDRDFSPR